MKCKRCKTEYYPIMYETGEEWTCDCQCTLDFSFDPYLWVQEANQCKICGKHIYSCELCEDCSKNNDPFNQSDDIQVQDWKNKQ